MRKYLAIIQKTPKDFTDLKTVNIYASTKKTAYVEASKIGTVLLVE